MKQILQLLSTIKCNVKITFFLTGLLVSMHTWAQLPTAQQIASRMKVGWNMGNTLEAICGEQAWGGAYTTQLLIDSVKAAGFNSVRLPCAWFCHSDTNTSVINKPWLDRVKEVVDYCIKDSMYVIVNIHWDNGWLENRVDTINQAQVNKRQFAYWTQIAECFKNYDEHLLFACANEPNRQDKADGRTVFETYVQTFIKAVRATGGNNSSRTLIFQGHAEETTKIPQDQIPDRLMFEAHSYPFQFSLWAKDDINPWCGCNDTLYAYYYWGKDNHSATDLKHNSTYGEEDDVDKFFKTLKTNFVDKGVPIILGEYGAWKRETLASGADRDLHNKSVEFFHYYMVNAALKNGAIPFVWDTNMGLFDRSIGKIRDRGIINAMMQGSKNVPVSIRTSRNPVCQGDSGIIYSIPYIQGVQYKWTYSGTGVTINNDTLNSISVKFSNTATSGKLTVNAKYPADSTWTFDVTVGTPVAQPGIITSGKEHVCAGDNKISYSVTNNPTMAYYWDFSGTGATFANCTANTIRISYGNDATGGTLKVTATKNGCSGSRTATITVNPMPAQPSVINASKNTVCVGDTGVTYSVVKDTTVIYNWSYSGTGSTISNGTTNVIRVNYNSAATSGTLTIKAIKPGGCNSNPRTLAVKVNSPPTRPSIISAPKNPVCQGEKGISYSVLKDASVSYNWTYSGAGAVILNGNTSIATINYTDNATSGILKVTVDNATGCVDTNTNNRTFAVKINSKPTDPGEIIASKNPVVQGDNGITYSVTNDPSVTYNWGYSGAGATILNGSTNIASVDYSATATSGNMSVTVINTSGCTNSNALAVTVNSMPDKINSASADDLFSVIINSGMSDVLVSYRLTYAATIQIELFNTQGRLIQRIEDAFKTPGSYHIHTSTSGLANGVYIIKYLAGRTMVQKKVLLTD
jgi:hypothetical protein